MVSQNLPLRCAHIAAEHRMSGSRFLVLASFFLTLFFFPACTVAGQSPIAEYAGRYTDGRGMAVYFEMTKYGLTIRPLLWTATQLLRETKHDNFEVADRTSRGARFYRDSTGRVAGVEIRGMDGEGLELRRSDSPLLPAEMLLKGNITGAVRGYRARGPAGLDMALELATQVLDRYPTQTAHTAAFLGILGRDISESSRFHSLYGYALVQAGRRGEALPQFRQAHRLDPSNQDAISGLARLGKLPADVKPDKEPWKIPFLVSSVFAKPTAAEIKAVEKDWALRDLTLAGVREELRDHVRLGTWNANIRIVSHLVHGSRHYGAIIYPDGAAPGTLPVIVVAKGVSPTYFPLDIADQPNDALMGEISDQFIYVMPSYRGEVLNFEGHSLQSEGDRRDALDGATDDTLALLSVALETTPAADGKRICIYGQSRGGNVALLAGIRDKRIKCVVDVSGPTDWFYLMGTNGWTEEELWTEAVRIHAKTQETGGQNLERFMMRAIEGKADLAAVRHNMIASSPLYFARRLPHTQLHYGIEDTSVPVRNGRRMVAEMKRAGVPASRYEAYFYPNEGHDTDRINGPAVIRKFISTQLNVK